MRNLAISLLLLGLLGLVSLPVSAQLHQAGQSAVELSGGFLDGFRKPAQDNFGYFAGIAYSQYRSRYTYWKAGAHLNAKQYAYDISRVPLHQYLGEGEIYTRIVGRVSRSVVVNAGLGVAGGYEQINGGQPSIDGARIINRSSWVAGPTVALEGEFLANDRLILLARAKEYYLFRSNVVRTRFNLGIGVKFILPTSTDE
ncbi:conjugal transfer protein TraO [Nibrella saemangeumensis]|uniref:Conjugal transfer protein TraO n=1 Tax=Nibrella saemangeumensis TaxID=1084526 RepID=A0ABP8N3Y8_9BACT